MMSPLNWFISAWEACVTHYVLSVGVLIAVVFLIVAGTFSDD